MNEDEYKKLVDEQKDKPIKKRIFKHKKTGEYETQINIFKLNEYVEVRK